MYYFRQAGILLRYNVRFGALLNAVFFAGMLSGFCIFDEARF